MEITSGEFSWAVAVAYRRKMGERAIGRIEDKFRVGREPGLAWQQEVDGAIAEYAVARHLGGWWEPRFDKEFSFSDPDVWVGETPVEARACSSPEHSLILRPRDRKKRAWTYLVLVEPGRATVLGAAWSSWESGRAWNPHGWGRASFLPVRTLVWPDPTVTPECPSCGGDVAQPLMRPDGRLANWVSSCCGVITAFKHKQFVTP